jgi:hypothetical protein
VPAPREDPEAGQVHTDQSPYRRRYAERLRPSVGRDERVVRGRIERTFGDLTTFGGRLT